MASLTNNGRKNKVILVTGPPNNGRDEYIRMALSNLKTISIGYHRVFCYMQKNAPACGIPNLTRENVFDVSKSKLEEIRDKAFVDVINQVTKSTNDIDIVSTPTIFRVPIRGDYYTGKVEGLNLEIIGRLNPDMIIVLIDDLLRVKERIKADPLRNKQGLKLKDLADWRESSIQIIKEYVDSARSKGIPIDFIIFAREHPITTFIDLILGDKPRLYISYHITGQQDFVDVKRMIQKLSEYFVCIDPYTIKDWQIVRHYDCAIEKGQKKVSIMTTNPYGKEVKCELDISEIEDAIDLIRSQIVERDLEIIANVHATVVYHRAKEPSYGVMVEVFHSATIVQRPVYVLYPFKARPSPFFEHYIKRTNIIQGDKPLTELEDELVEKLKAEYKAWPTWRPSLRRA